MDQGRASERNRRSWTAGVYDAWCQYLGTPEIYAASEGARPERRLRQHLHLLGELRGARIANLLGSNGRRAVPLAQLGARVTVVDISTDNARYAREYARAALVELEYIVSDLLAWDVAPHAGQFDVVYIEGGVLQYFMELRPAVEVMRALLRSGGRLVLSDYHPIRACVAAAGEPARASDYFAGELRAGGFPADEMGLDLPNGVEGVLRHWTLGEIVTTVAETRFEIARLEEAKLRPEDRLPGVFSLLAFAR